MIGRERHVNRGASLLVLAIVMLGVVRPSAMQETYKPGPSDLALPPAAGPTIFVAVREQLGLKLEPVDASLAVIVIDQAERH